MQRASTRFRTVRLGSAVLVAATSVAAAPTASAHDSLVGSTPAAGQTLATAPTAVTLRFDEPVLSLGDEIRITTPSGKAEVAKASVHGTSVGVPLTATERGTYHVGWRVTSADGQPVSGDFDFVVGAAGTTTGGVAVGRSANVSGPTTPTLDEPGDNEPALVLGGTIAVSFGLVAAWFVARRRVRDDPR